MPNSLISISNLYIQAFGKKVWINQNPNGMTQLTLEEVEHLRNHLNWLLECISQEIMSENISEE